MTNQEAIKILSELHDQCCQADSIFCTDTTGARCDAVDMAISALEKQIPKELIAEAVQKLPSAQPEPRWIPCNERLPEVGTYVIISKKALNFRSNLPSVCTAHRSCDPRSGKEEWNDMLFGKLDDDDVLAWLPLPEPYKEDTE